MKQLPKGKNYHLLQPVYSLNFVNDIFEPDLEGYYHYYNLVHYLHSEKVLDGLHLVFVELPKFKAKNLTERKMQVLWLRFLTEINEDTKRAPKARLDDSRKDDGKHLWHGGEFVLVANGAAQSRSSAAPDGYIRPERAFGGDLPDANWWTGESFVIPGYGHAERFYIRFTGAATHPSPTSTNAPSASSTSDSSGRFQCPRTAPLRSGDGPSHRIGGV